VAKEKNKMKDICEWVSAASRRAQASATAKARNTSPAVGVTGGMMLEWSEFVGPNTQKAEGFSGIYVINKKEEEKHALYLFKRGVPLCPVNKERAEAYYEFGSEVEAQEGAQLLEDKISRNALLLLRKMKDIAEQEL
jgi:hypothetical protein